MSEREPGSPPTGIAARRTALYRLYGANDQLLYIGASGNLETRWKTHAKERLWWPEVARRELTWYDTRAEATRAEKRAIEVERPKYNILHTPRHAAVSERRLICEEHREWVWARSQDGYGAPQHRADIQALLAERKSNDGDG